MEKREIISKIWHWVFFLFIVYLIYELIRKIFGFSLTLDIIISTIVLANLTFCFYLKGDLAKLRAEMSKELSESRAEMSKETASIKDLIHKESKETRSLIHRLELRMVKLEANQN